MKTSTAGRKRPCRVCRRWFCPDARLGDRQKTCGSPECQRKWHRRGCAAWNRKNRDYYRSLYLDKKLESAGRLDSSSSGFQAKEAVNSPGAAGPVLKLPLPAVQEVISIQQVVFIEYLIRLSFKGFKESIKRQVIVKPG